MGETGDNTRLKRKRSTSSDSVSSSCWQFEINSMSIADKWKYMFENKLHTDTRLIIGENLEVIECHRIVLILSSPVFETMLSPRWLTNSTPLAITNETKEEIQLPSDDPCSIKLLVSCFYNGDPVTEDEALDLLLISKKYLCQQVTNMCLQLLKSSTNDKNLIPIFQTAFLADEPELLKQAESSILSKAWYLVRVHEFSKFKLEHLKYFLAHDDLNVDEVDLFNEVYEWGKLECERRNLDAAKRENISEVLKDIFPFIRFRCMDLEDFSVYVVSKNVLPLEQTVEVYKFLATPPVKLNMKAEEPGDMEEPGDLVELEEPADLMEEPVDLMEEPVDLMEELGDLMEEPEDLVEEPADLVQEPGDLVEEPADLMEEPGNLVEEPADLMEEPGDLVEVPANLMEKLADLMEEPEHNLNLQFNKTKPRSRKLISYIFKRLKVYSLYNTYRFDFGQRWNNFCFQADQDIKLVSLGFFRSIQPDLEIVVSVRILDEEMTQILSEFQETATCSRDVDVFHLFFPKHVRISKKVFYTISYMIEGHETHYDWRNPPPWSCDELCCSSDVKINFSFKEAKDDTDMDQVPELGFQL